VPVHYVTKHLQQGIERRQIKGAEKAALLVDLNYRE